MSALTSGATTVLLTNLKALGIDTPAAITEALDIRNKIQEYAPPTNLAGNLYEAIKAGRNPIEDQSFIDSVLAYHALKAGVTANALDLADRDLSRAVDNTVPELFKSLQTVFKRETARITKAREALGDVRLEDGSSMMAQSPELAKQWATAINAEATLQSIRQTRNILGRIIGKTQVNFAASFLDVVPNEHDRSERNFWDLTAYVLRGEANWALNSHDEETLNIQRLQRERELLAAQRAAEEQRGRSLLRYL